MIERVRLGIKDNFIELQDFRRREEQIKISTHNARSYSRHAETQFARAGRDAARARPDGT
jgi:hypothetical protein